MTDEGRQDGLASVDHVSDKPFVHFEQSFVFRKIPLFMTLGKNSPDCRHDSESMWQHLKHQVAVLGTEAQAT